MNEKRVADSCAQLWRIRGGMLSFFGPSNFEVFAQAAARLLSPLRGCAPLGGVWSAG